MLWLLISRLRSTSNYASNCMGFQIVSVAVASEEYNKCVNRMWIAILAGFHGCWHVAMQNMWLNDEWKKKHWAERYG